MPMSNVSLLATRPTPIAISLFLVCGYTAVDMLTDPGQAARLAQATSLGWVTAWAVLLLAGSVVATAGALHPRKWLIQGLLLEALGEFVLAGLLSVYVIALARAPLPSVTIALTTGFIAGFTARAIQALYERWRIERFKRFVMQSIIASVSIDSVDPGAVSGG